MHDANKEFAFLFLLVFVLGLAFGVVIGCFAFSGESIGDLTVEVEHQNGNALPDNSNFNITVTDSNGNVVGSTTTDSNYEALFADLDDGTYTVTANYNNGSQTDTKTVTIAGGQDETVTFTFPFNGQDPLKSLEESTATN